LFFCFRKKCTFAAYFILLSMNLESVVRKSILNLKPYSCARDEFKGEASVYLDANESPYNLRFNRYPDPLQEKLKEQIIRTLISVEINGSLALEFVSCARVWF
jgi:histidinol-phosphate/aromatic aminotransferase/cobyric acid decarboxylase-like protein